MLAEKARDLFNKSRLLFCRWNQLVPVSFLNRAVGFFEEGVDNKVHGASFYVFVLISVPCLSPMFPRKHAARTEARIEYAAFVGFKYGDEHLHDALRGVELAAALGI